MILLTLSLGFGRIGFVNRGPERNLGSGRVLVGERKFPARSCLLRFDERDRIMQAEVVVSAGNPVKWQRGDGQSFGYWLDEEVVLYWVK